MQKKVYFISDVHLGLTDRAHDRKKEDLLLEFLRKIEDSCETLVINGDLFDYWFEYKYVVPKYFYALLTALRSMREKGIEIIYIMGNHDFGHRNYFESELDIKINENDITQEFFAKKFYISHGDGKSNKDYGYKILKKILRNKLSLFLFRWIHPDLGIRMASKSSKTSRSYTGKKDWGERDGMREFAENKIKEGFDYVVMGHRHKAELSQIANGYYLDLGDWVGKETFAVFDGEEMKLEFVRDFLAG